MYSLTGYVHKYFLGYNKFRQKGGNHMNTIITIGRQFGSGGHEIGEKLAQHYGIKCYDKELLSRAAKESGFCEEMLQNHDERREHYKDSAAKAVYPGFDLFHLRHNGRNE